MFNVARWGDDATRPKCCHVVPVLAKLDVFDTGEILSWARALRDNGSVAAPGFMNPEGVVVFHEPSQTLFKYTLDGDAHKGALG